MSVAINGTNGITYNDGTVQASAPVGKNKIINGDMRVDQRDGTATINATGVTYNVDRWLGRGESSEGVFTLAQDTTSPANFTNSLKATVTTADSSIASGSSYRIQQMVEGYNIADLNWGTSDAQSVTLSFWVRSSVTGTLGGSVGNGDYNRFNPFSYTISSANTWEYKTVTIAGDTSGTWVTNNALGLRLNFSLGAGADRLGTAGTWTSSIKEGATGQVHPIQTNGSTFYITGVQLETGTSATPFENLQYGQQLARCQRYYQQYGSSGSTAIGAGMWFTTTQILGLFTFPVIMRAAPTITTTGTGWLEAYRPSGSSTTTGTGNFDVIANHSARFNVSGWSTAGTAGQAAYLQLNDDKYIFISAEL